MTRIHRDVQSLVDVRSGVRLGDYRIIYKINEVQRVITILNVGHRRDVYR